MSVPPSAHDELAAEYWSEFVRASWLRTCASIGASWLRTWASWLLLLPRIAYRRLHPPPESLLTSNVDVLEEVLSHCDAEALSAAMAVCRAVRDLSWQVPMSARPQAKGVVKAEEVL